MELESPGLAEFLARLMEQCASLEELRLAFRPQMDPRWVLSSYFLGFVSRKGGTIRNRPEEKLEAGLAGAQVAAPLPGTGAVRASLWCWGPLVTEERAARLTQVWGETVVSAVVGLQGKPLGFQGGWAPRGQAFPHHLPNRRAVPSEGSRPCAG